MKRLEGGATSSWLVWTGRINVVQPVSIFSWSGQLQTSATQNQILQHVTLCKQCELSNLAASFANESRETFLTFAFSTDLNAVVAMVEILSAGWLSLSSSAGRFSNQVKTSGFLLHGDVLPMGGFWGNPRLAIRSVFGIDWSTVGDSIQSLV